jgi:hypothetical protein
MKKQERQKVVPLYVEVKHSTKETLKAIKEETRKPFGVQIDEMVEIYSKLNKN